jgi:hypothetical protein
MPLKLAREWRRTLLDDADLRRVARIDESA